MRQQVSGSRRQPPPVRIRGGQAAASIRQRERADRRRRRRKRRNVLFYTILFLLVIGIAVLLCFTVLFKLETISLTGSSRYSVEEIVQASGLKKGENLFRQDLDEAAASIKERLPHVGEAVFSRKLPAEIVISVSEAEVAGVVIYNGQNVLLDSEGKVLEAVSAVPENCPVFKGLKVNSAEPGKVLEYADAEQKKTVDALMDALETSNVDKITEFDFSDIYNLRILYDDRIELKLGVSTDLNYKLRFFMEGLIKTGKLTEADRGTLDLSQSAETNRAYFKDGEVTSSAVNSEVSSEPESSNEEPDASEEPISSDVAE